MDNGWGVRGVEIKATTSNRLLAPFPWFGGKSRAAPLVWEKFGDVHNYVEPFFGSGAVLLGRPHAPQIETVNDLDGYLANFWRAVKYAPEETAAFADWPVNENDLSARHLWLIGQRETLQARLSGDPDFFDPKIAGWWVWGLCSWIGSGWCSGDGPWQADETGALVDTRKLPHLRNAGHGVNRQRPHLGNSGQGVNSQLPHLGDAGQGVKRKLPHLGNSGQGVKRKLPHLGDAGRGVNRQLPHLGDAGQGVNRQRPHLGDAGQGILSLFEALSERLRGVRVCSGDWTRVIGDSPTVKLGMTGVFLDPPYSAEADRADLYRMDDLTVANDVRAWCIANGDKPNLRIALCGYAGEGHETLTDLGWDEVPWKAKGGYAAQSKKHENPNARRERIWFSPSCLSVTQGKLM